jgi:hypothetical protein
MRGQFIPEINTRLDFLQKNIRYRFHRLACGNADSTRSQGLIAAGMENGEPVLWDPDKIVGHAE